MAGVALNGPVETQSYATYKPPPVYVKGVLNVNIIEVVPAERGMVITLANTLVMPVIAVV